VPAAPNGPTQEGSCAGPPAPSPSNPAAGGSSGTTKCTPPEVVRRVVRRAVAHPGRTGRCSRHPRAPGEAGPHPRRRPPTGRDPRRPLAAGDCTLGRASGGARCRVLHVRPAPDPAVTPRRVGLPDSWVWLRLAEPERDDHLDLRNRVHDREGDEEADDGCPGDPSATNQEERLALTAEQRLHLDRRYEQSGRRARGRAQRRIVSRAPQPGCTGTTPDDLHGWNAWPGDADQPPRM
jgi:hypothetical protein